MAVSAPVPPSSTEGVAALAEAAMTTFARAERRVARVLLADYPNAALGTAAELAERADVSAPTVVRFARRLGFTGYAELQGAVRSEIAGLRDGPLSRLPTQRPTRTPDENLLVRAQAQFDRTMSYLRAISPQVLEQTVDLLSDTSRHVLLVGGRFSTLLAKNLAMQLEELRPGVTVLEDAPGSNLGALVDLRRHDVVVVFDFVRFQRSTLELARTVRRVGASIVLVTDDLSCPVAPEAAVVLAVSSDSDLAFASMSGAFMLTELLVGPITDRLGEAGATRLARWEQFRAGEVFD